MQWARTKVPATHVNTILICESALRQVPGGYCPPPARGGDLPAVSDHREHVSPKAPGQLDRSHKALPRGGRGIPIQAIMTNDYCS